MFFPAMFTIITGSSFEMVTNCSCLFMIVRVYGEVNGRGGRGAGRVDGRVCCWGGIVFDGNGNFVGIFAAFSLAMLVQHMHFKTLIPFTFEVTNLALKLKLHSFWG